VGGVAGAVVDGAVVELEAVGADLDSVGVGVACLDAVSTAIRVISPWEIQQQAKLSPVWCQPDETRAATVQEPTTMTGAS